MLEEVGAKIFEGDDGAGEARGQGPLEGPLDGKLVLAFDFLDKTDDVGEVGVQPRGVEGLHVLVEEGDRHDVVADVPLHVKGLLIIYNDGITKKNVTIYVEKEK